MVVVQVTSVTLSEEAFSVENGLLTPTMKLKRPQAKAKFQDAINRWEAVRHRELSIRWCVW